LENIKRIALGCPLLSALGPSEQEILAREFIAYDALLCGVPAARDFDRLSLILNIPVRSVGVGRFQVYSGQARDGRAYGLYPVAKSCARLATKIS
jgi:hypothetical protein